jgi:lipoprotein-releasing system permease protein
MDITVVAQSSYLNLVVRMIVLDKRKDISILQSMGASPTDVRKIFMRSGWMICFLGLAIGIILAVGFYILQKQFGIVPIPEGFVVDSYPIELRWIDILIVGITVFIIGTLAAILPARKASKIAAYIRKE